MQARPELDEAKIRRHVNQLAEAIQAKDLEGLRQLYATDVVSFDVEPPLQHVGVEAKLKNWARAFLFFQEVTYEVRDLALAVGDEVAFGHCPGHLLLPETRRRLADRARPGLCAVRCAKRQGRRRP
jgi:ketosteroid isomerase-like protein